MILMHLYSLGNREGALLQVDGGVCDVHPWPELGDLPLSNQLSLLAEGKTTPLTARSLEFARIDAKARSEKKSLFEGLVVPDSHFLFQNESQLDKAIEEGFTTFKIKVRGQFSHLPSLLKTPNIKWRLDFNGSLTEDAAQDFLSRDLNVSAIEFCEDPGIDSFPLPVAWDRLKPAHYDFRVIKPAVDDWQNMPLEKPYIVTSYLGHPIGQAADAYAAARLGCRQICGLLSHRAYPKNEFSEGLSWQGPQWKIPEGAGFGFDSLLQKIDWKCLIGII